MSQHDYILADASGSAFLADLNLAVKALAENNYGTTEPTVMYAHMWWADTTADILKKRNAANTGWISYLTLSTGALIGNAATSTLADNATGSVGNLGAVATLSPPVSGTTYQNVSGRPKVLMIAAQQGSAGTLRLWAQISATSPATSSSVFGLIIDTTLTSTYIGGTIIVPNDYYYAISASGGGAVGIVAHEFS